MNLVRDLKSNKNLFIVGTPLQLLNAIEALKHFDLGNNILVIVHRSLEANKAQMESIKELYEWEEIIDIEYSKSSSILKYINLVKYLKKYTYKYLFIPKLEVVPKLVIPNVEKEKVFLLDDGVMTISLYENNLKTNKLNKYDFKELRFMFFGMKIKIKDKINLFTYFDLEPINKIEIVKNNLTFLKKTYLEGTSVDDSTIYFLGHPSSKYISDEDYLKSVHNLIKTSNKKIVYIPHRGESKEMKSIFHSIENTMFSVVDINMPVELYFLENKIHPSHIISYYSTALITLKIIYQECQVDFVTIDISKDINNTLRNIYKIFDSEGLGKISLKGND